MKIILNADDFGRSHERNLAIDYAIKNNLIKSVGLLINTDYTEEAVKMAVDGGYVNRVHLHLNLISGDASGNSKPLNSEFIKGNVYCSNGSFKKAYDLSFGEKYNPNYYKIIYKEIEAQVSRFRELFNGYELSKHIDFHFYYNHYLPVALAMKLLISEYNFKTVRYIGEHQKNGNIKQKIKNVLLRALGKNSNAKEFKSCNIDYYLTKKDCFLNDDIIELYVHPDYIDGQLQDNTISAFGHEKRLLKEQINSLNNVEFISWEDIK